MGLQFCEMEIRFRWSPHRALLSLVLKELPPELVKAREVARSNVGTGRKRLSAKSMKDEITRQAWTYILVQGPMQLLQRAIVFVKSGAIFQPRNIIMMVSVGVAMMSGFSACSMKRSHDRAMGTSERKLRSCKRDVQALSDSTSSGVQTVQIISEITGSVTLSRALKEDSTLRRKVEEEAQALMNADPQWLKNSKKVVCKKYQRWAKTINALDENDFDPVIQDLLLWAPSYIPRTSSFDGFKTQKETMFAVKAC